MCINHKTMVNHGDAQSRKATLSSTTMKCCGYFLKLGCLIMRCPVCTVLKTSKKEPPPPGGGGGGGFLFAIFRHLIPKCFSRPWILKFPLVAATRWFAPWWACSSRYRGCNGVIRLTMSKSFVVRARSHWQKRRWGFKTASHQCFVGGFDSLY